MPICAISVPSGDGGWIHLGPDVAAFLDSLAKQKTLLDPYPGTVQVAEAEGDAAAKGVTFDSKVTITAKALSNRYDPKAGN